MSSRRGHARRDAVRLVAVLAVLCGVLAMHGLSVGHLPAAGHLPGIQHHVAAPVAASQPVPLQHVGTGTGDASSVDGHGSAGCLGCVDARPGGAQASPAFGLCLAVLSAGALALILAATAAGSPRSLPRDVARRLVLPALVPRPPVLSALGVLRT